MNEAPANSSGLASIKGRLWAYLGCVILVLAYAWIVGPIAFVGDSYYLCDPAKYMMGKSLPGSGGLFFFYRPLVSFLWLPAYFFGRPESIVLAIQVINVLIYASAIWPALFLLRGYARLTARESFLVALVFMLSPCVLIYSPMLLTEAIFTPLFLFLVLATWRRTQTPGLGWDAACGSLIGLCYLSRHAGSIVPVAWAFAEAARLVGCGKGWKTGFGPFKSAAIVVAIAALPIGLWMVGAQYLDKNSASGAGASLLAELAGGHEYALAWAVNLVQYLLWSPAGFLLLVGALVYLTSPTYFIRDPTALFVLGTSVLAILSTVLFQDSHWGDRSLTLNRYLAPYVIPLSIIAWRYVQAGTVSYVIGAAAILGISWVLGFPERMNTHFPDYLAWMKLIPVEFQGWKLLIHLVFGLGMALGLICCWRRWRSAAIFVFVAFTFVWDLSAAAFWRNRSMLVSRPALEGASKVWAAIDRDHAAIVLDDQWPMDREVLLFQCFYPDRLPKTKFERVLSLARENPALRLVSRDRLSVGAPFGWSAPVWEFPRQLPADLVSLAGVMPFPDEDIVRFKVAGQREDAVAMSDDLTLNVECTGKGMPGELALRVISPETKRELRIANEAGVSQASIQIPAATLKDGWHEVRVPIGLHPGINSLKLSVDGPIASLNRRKARLIVADRIDFKPAGKTEPK